MIPDHHDELLDDPRFRAALWHLFTRTVFWSFLFGLLAGYLGRMVVAA